MSTIKGIGFESADIKMDLYPFKYLEDDTVDKPCRDSWEIPTPPSDNERNIEGVLEEVDKPVTDLLDKAGLKTLWLGPNMEKKQWQLLLPGLLSMSE